jgi:hypothetical protein
MSFEVDLQTPDLSIWVSQWEDDGCVRVAVGGMPKWSDIELEMFTLEGMLSIAATATTFIVLSTYVRESLT